MTPLSFAWRCLTRQLSRALLGVAGITAVGALLFDMLLLSDGLVVSFRDLLDEVGFDVRVTATDALPGMGPPIEDAAEAVRTLAALPEIDEVFEVAFGRGEVPRDDAPALEVWFRGSGATSGHTWVVVDGEDLPRAETGAEPWAALVDRNLARREELRPGSTVRVRCVPSSLPPVRLRVVGIADFRFDAVDALSVVTRPGAFRRACGREDAAEADMLLVGSTPAAEPAEAVEAIRRARPDLHAFSNEQFLARFRNNDFSYFKQVSFMLSTITIFFAFLLVTTLLTVSVNQRLGEIAALRALGFARRRIVADIVWESALLVGTGGLLALPVGALLARWLDAILRSMPGLPERLHFFVFEPRTLWLHLALVALTWALAVAYPLYLAVRLPIAETLRRETL